MPRPVSRMPLQRLTSLPWWLPIPLTGLAALLLLTWAYGFHGGDVEAVFHVGNPKQGTGYDGQFVYFMARNLHPHEAEAYLDVPAYRYQRILLPLLAHLLSGGEPRRILFAVWGLSLAGHLLGTAVWSLWLRRWRVSPGWGLLYGLWPGLLLSLRLGMTEPLAYGLALAGLWAVERRRTWLAAGLLLAAVLTKETTLPFVAAAGVGLWQWKSAMASPKTGRREWLHAMRQTFPFFAAAVLLPWALWQAWLFHTFGRPGLGIGGHGATPPLPVPFGGLLQALLALPWTWKALYLLVFGPSMLLPLALGLAWAGRQWRYRDFSPWSTLMLTYGFLAAAMPMGSWDPFAIIRVLFPGLVAFWAIALQTGRFALLRRLGPFWAALLAFVVAR